MMRRTPVKAAAMPAAARARIRSRPMAWLMRAVKMGLVAMIREEMMVVV